MGKLHELTAITTKKYSDPIPCTLSIWLDNVLPNEIEWDFYMYHII